MEQTLVILKPDAVQRGLMGNIITRFENAGLKIVGMKMVWVDKEFAEKHYFDVAERRGQKVLDNTLKVITEGPVVALVIEGPHTVELGRKIVGPTEPRVAPPGTIRGDFAIHSFAYTDKADKAVKNTVHASGSVADAEIEIKLWFTKDELHSYKTVHEVHVF